MSIQAVGWAMKSGPKECGRKFLLVALANYADEEGECWPSIARLAQDTAQDRRTVQRHLRALEDDGFLERTTDPIPDTRIRADRRPTMYRLKIQKRGGVLPPRAVFEASDGAAPVQSRGGVMPPNPSEEPSPDSVPSEPAGAPPAAPWSKEACDDWIEQHGRGSAHGGKIGNSLKPLVLAHTWEAVRPAWRRYCLETKEKTWANAANFREHYDAWASGRAHVNGNPNGHSEYDLEAFFR
jgi:DNA-binding transcriptional ArsR family regulator